MKLTPDNGLSFDTETHLIQKGLLAPPLVCGSAASVEKGYIFDRVDTLVVFQSILVSRGLFMVGANIAYDLLVCAMELAKEGQDFMPHIFQALEEGRIFDVQIAEALNAIADGFLYRDPRTGGPLINPDTGKQGRYSLATCVDLVLGRKDAKKNDEWRLRYAELENIPMAEWPQPALNYPVDDAVNTLECGLAQASRHRNLHDLSNQVYTAFAMHLGAAWGFKVNQASVDIIERHAMKKHDDDKKFIEAGILREDGTQDLSRTKKLVALAYGASEPCWVCRGNGKIINPNATLIRCPTCKGAGVRNLAGLVHGNCPSCHGIGRIENPKALINCANIPDALAGPDEVKTKTCDGTGLVLVGEVPRSEKEGVGYGRDVLHESGDELLMAFADWNEDAKRLSVYVPYLRQARVEGRDVPLNLRPNVLLETGRTSYGDVIQLFPRASGFMDGEEYVPSLRECIEARPGRVFSSTDYKAGELITHAQSCIWITGYSDLGEALKKGVDPHSALAATVLGVSYEDFLANKKLKRNKDARQAAKPWNFGKPGGMGAVKIVLQQRKQGPDTPHPSGPSMVKDGDKLVPGYKGLRFCILMGHSERCGETKVTTWKDRSIPPTCKACIECAVHLDGHWKRQWRENAP